MLVSARSASSLRLRLRQRNRSRWPQTCRNWSTPTLRRIKEIITYNNSPSAFKSHWLLNLIATCAICGWSRSLYLLSGSCCSIVLASRSLSKSTSFMDLSIDEILKVATKPVLASSNDWKALSITTRWRMTIQVVIRYYYYYVKSLSALSFNLALYVVNILSINFVT